VKIVFDSEEFMYSLIRPMKLPVTVNNDDSHSPCVVVAVVVVVVVVIVVVSFFHYLHISGSMQ